MKSVVIESAAKAIARSELAPEGQRVFDTDRNYWNWAFSAREREVYRKQARAALIAVNINVRSRRALKTALDQERRRADKLQAKLEKLKADHLPTEKRYDKLGEMRCVARAEGRLMVRRFGRAVSSFTMDQKEWDASPVSRFGRTVRDEGNPDRCKSLPGAACERRQGPPVLAARRGHEAAPAGQHPTGLA